ncbi:MAG TPA: DUF2884 family protein [Luteimonas sp.]
MKPLRTTTLAIALAATAALAGCNRPAADQAAASATEAGDNAGESRGFIASAIDKGIADARKELHEGNLVISGDHRVDVSVGGWKFKSDNAADGTRPRAEITPQGDLLVEGKAVDVTPDQRRLLLAYRTEVLKVADTGLAIGSKGADLAGKAVGEAIGAIFGGDTKAMEQRVEAEADKLKQEAKVICTQLPALLAAQDALAASLPAFQPYATMTREDVDDCLADLEDDRPSA